ncbi:DUF2087 domain-containing protein [Hominenteromicrobium sp.]|uniref:DUF2087 domain-containing protein n=1 Tax=Hominenteromicrobium sp. TaxID=3073581 RepID=UPI003A936249
MEIYKDIQPFLDENGRLTSFPTKKRKQLTVLYYLSEKFEPMRDYTEKGINEVINTWTCFKDPATLRRELYNKYLLDREADGSRYRKHEGIPSLPEFIEKYM